MTDRLQGRLLRVQGIPGFRRASRAREGLCPGLAIACRAGSYGFRAFPVFVGASRAREVLMGRDELPAGQRLRGGSIGL